MRKGVECIYKMERKTGNILENAKRLLDKGQVIVKFCGL